VVSHSASSRSWRSPHAAQGLAWSARQLAARRSRLLCLSALYVVLDRSKTMPTPHLFAAALAPWDYPRIFGDCRGDHVAEAILNASPFGDHWPSRGYMRPSVGIGRRRNSPGEGEPNEGGRDG
jgi:hypothetical protein